MRAVSVEDDAAEEARLESEVARYAAERGVAIEVEHVEDAEAFLAAGASYDMAFLDIDLPGMSGMDAATLLRGFDRTMPIVFVTSLAQYAVRGYEVDAVGFIVKPVHYYDLRMCLDKVMRVIARRSDEVLSFATRTGVVAFPVSSVCFVETAGHNLVFRFVDGNEPFRIRESMARLEERLASMPFVRLSQSQLANMAHIRRVGHDSVFMSTGDELFFSRQRRKPCMERIAQYLGRTI